MYNHEVIDTILAQTEDQIGQRKDKARIKSEIEINKRILKLLGPQQSFETEEQLVEAAKAFGVENVHTMAMYCDLIFQNFVAGDPPLFDLESYTPEDLSTGKRIFAQLYRRRNAGLEGALKASKAESN